MHLHGLASAFPPYRLTQSEALEQLETSAVAGRLQPRARTVLRKVLANPDSGIRERRFATDHFQWLFGAEAEALNRYYEASAPPLAEQAARKALSQAGVQLEAVDALLVASCTGYLCPGVSSYVAERLGLRDDVILLDVTGLGCGAAIPLMRQAEGMISRAPDALVLTVAVEVCSAAFYLDDNAGVLISAALFGDGAAAAVWGANPPIHGQAWRADTFQSIHLPDQREKLRFENRGGKLRNVLEREIPEVAAEAVVRLAERMELPHDLRLIAHGGGRNVLDAVSTALGGPSLEEARWVLERYGNISSPSVLVALERALATGCQEALWMVSFGAGFSAHACRLTPVMQNGACHSSLRPVC